MRYALWGVRLLDTRAALLSLDDTLKRVYDPYAFVRDAYLQRRAYLVSDGKLAEEAPLEDPDADAGKPPPDSKPP